MPALSRILEHKIVAIIRGAKPADVPDMAEALYEGGIRILEITMNSDDPLEVIRKVIARMGDKMTIGAGTVLDIETVKQVVDAGASFVLSPVTDPEVIHAAKSLGVVSIPGAYTATEVFHAFRSGADIIKVFPASSPAYIKDLAAPLPQIPLLPTGGITVANIADFQNAGAVGFGIGSALVNTKKEVTRHYLEELTEKAAAFVQAIHPIS